MITTDNLPAFPGETSTAYFTGILQRDYFAAKAMQALVEKYNRPEVHSYDIAFHAYSIADAMMEQRRPENPPCPTSTTPAPPSSPSVKF